MKKELAIDSLNFSNKTEELKIGLRSGILNTKLFTALLDFLFDAADSDNLGENFFDFNFQINDLLFINADHDLFQTYYRKFVEKFISFPSTYLEDRHRIDFIVGLMKACVYNTLESKETLVIPSRRIKYTLVTKPQAKFNLFLVAIETTLLTGRSHYLDYHIQVFSFFKNMFLESVSGCDYSSRLYYVIAALFILLSQFSSLPSVRFKSSVDSDNQHFQIIYDENTVTEKMYTEIMIESHRNMSLDDFINILSLMKKDNLQYVSYNGEEKSFSCPKDYEPIRSILQKLVEIHLEKKIFELLEIAVKAVSDLTLPKVLTHLISQYWVSDADKELINSTSIVPQWKNLTTFFALTHCESSNLQKQKNEESLLNIHALS